MDRNVVKPENVDSLIVGRFTPMIVILSTLELEHPGKFRRIEGRVAFVTLGSFTIAIVHE